MNLNFMQKEEKEMNLVMFIANIAIAVAAFGYVMLFLGRNRGGCYRFSNGSF